MRYGPGLRLRALRADANRHAHGPDARQARHTLKGERRQNAGARAGGPTLPTATAPHSPTPETGRTPPHRTRATLSVSVSRPPARSAAAAAARAPRAHSRSKPPCRHCPPLERGLRVCEVVLDRSSSFTCRVGRVWRTRPTSLRRRPRGGAAARPPCAASRGRKLHCNQNVRGSSWRTTHR